MLLAKIISNYFHVRYSHIANPQTAADMTEVPDDYIGTYVDEVKEDSNNPKKYTWTRFRGLQGEDGKDGIPGQNGADGTTYYLHIKYMTEANYTKFVKNNDDPSVAMTETPAEYIGQLVDTTQADSDVPKLYKWLRLEGISGRTYFVETGVDVLKHVDGNQPVMPEVFTVSSYYRDGGTPDKIPYPAYFSVTCSQDGTTFDTVLYESTSKESSKDVSLSMLDVGLDAAIKLLTAIAVRVIVSDKAKPQGLEDALDVKTIPLLTDGKDGKDVTDLTPEEVFNALTDHGRIQGIKMEGDSLYINATYINSGTLTGDLIRGGTIDGVIFTSTANGYMNWTLNQVNPIGESYIMGLNLSAGAINGYTYSNDEPFLTYGYSTNNQSSIRFNFPFSESGVRNYYAFGLESNNAICLKAPTLYIWNRDEETSSGTVSRFDMGMTGSVNIVTNEIVYIGGLPQQRVITLVFNKGIMVAALG